jgi:succinate dehydrogenase hydrophobic anchor subunit
LLFSLLQIALSLCCLIAEPQAHYESLFAKFPSCWWHLFLSFQVWRILLGSSDVDYVGEYWQ